MHNPVGKDQRAQGSSQASPYDRTGFHIETDFPFPEKNVCSSYGDFTAASTQCQWEEPAEGHEALTFMAFNQVYNQIKLM
jgi:hypothetical protein